MNCKQCGIEYKYESVCRECGNEHSISNSASVTGYKAMSLDRAITILKDRVDSNECEGECDEGKPYTKCKGCEAASVLNEIKDIVRAAL